MDKSQKVYGVEQSCHGHNYRWIFDKEALENQGIDLSNAKNVLWEDIRFPIGGSNSSATSIVELDSLEAIESFLTEEYFTDYEDPTLVDIAEGICTIAVGDDSITERYIEKLQIPKDKITTENGYLKEAEDMIQALREAGTDFNVDYENPFYGYSRDMRLSELNELYSRVNQDKSEENTEIEGPGFELD